MHNEVVEAVRASIIKERTIVLSTEIEQAVLIKTLDGLNNGPYEIKYNQNEFAYVIHGVSHKVNPWRILICGKAPSPVEVIKAPAIPLTLQQKRALANSSMLEDAFCCIKYLMGKVEMNTAGPNKLTAELDLHTNGIMNEDYSPQVLAAARIYMSKHKLGLLTWRLKDKTEGLLQKDTVLRLPQFENTPEDAKYKKSLISVRNETTVHGALFSVSDLGYILWYSVQ